MKRRPGVPYNDWPRSEDEARLEAIEQSMGSVTNGDVQWLIASVRNRDKALQECATMIATLKAMRGVPTGSPRYTGTGPEDPF